jgi:beta-lactam-binding protein with PASTA domain
MRKNYTINIPVEKFWKVFLPSVIVICIAGFVIGIFAVDRFIMPKVVGVNKDMVEVPGVGGLSYEDARHKFFQVGLLTEIRSRDYDDKIPLDAVINQTPEAGIKVKKGRHIALTISKGKEIGVIPDIRNLSEHQARIELKNNGFTVGNVKKIYSDEKPVDVVIDAYPESGTTVSREIEIDILISKGAKPTHAEVPNLVGENLADAKKKIEDSGLKLGKISYQNNKSVSPGTVVSQSVSPGSSVPLESAVNIVVSVIK